ncbi:MAG TPA: hypothetical protein VK171_09970, partial [Fimbriimonas sp.]|nr:hypothetical protein [Fimbriimonas sp.]
NSGFTTWSTHAMAPLVLPKDVPVDLGVAITSGRDDLRDDSTLEMFYVYKPKDMFSQPRTVVQVVNWGKDVRRLGATGLWRGSSIPANSTLEFGTIAGKPFPATMPADTPKLSDLVSIGIGIRPGPGGETWNGDDFTIKGLRFFYNDNGVLRELWNNQTLDIKLGQERPIFMADCPPLRFGTVDLSRLSDIPIKPVLKGGGQ